MNNNLSPEEIFDLYKKGCEYNRQIGLYERVKENQNFFIGKQWEGVNAPELDKPVFNILKRVCNMFVSLIVSDDITAQVKPFSALGSFKETEKIIEKEIDRVMERSRMRIKNRDVLKNACIDGDACVYMYFNEEAPTGQAAKGTIDVDVIDNTNVFFQNTASNDVQSQNYILIMQRKLLDDVKDEARRNGISENIVSGIEPDGDENSIIDNEDEKNITVITRFYKKDGKVFCSRSCQNAFIKEEFDTGLRLYPIAYMSWEKIKNSYHGQAAVTELIPNQLFINKCYAMGMDYVKKLAFPKLIYDGNKFVNGFSTKIGEAIRVNGNVTDAVATAFKMPDMSSQVMELVEKTMSYTKEYMGATDAMLGNINFDNASAIVALQQASNAPLELIKLGFYQFVEDYVRVFVDIMQASYGVRFVSYENENGEDTERVFDFSGISDMEFDLNVEIGASSYWSEISQIQTVDNLYSKGIITDAKTYLESIPDGYIPNKKKIIENTAPEGGGEETA